MPPNARTQQRWTYGSFVVTKMSSRGTPESRIALPTCSSFAVVRRASVATPQSWARGTCHSQMPVAFGSDIDVTVGEDVDPTHSVQMTVPVLLPLIRVCSNADESGTYLEGVLDHHFNGFSPARGAHPASTQR